MSEEVDILKAEVERLTVERDALALGVKTWEEIFLQTAGGEVAEFDMSEVSDGYHTFNELYRHRAVLFAALQSAYRSRSWKSRKHADGTMFDGMFIAGIETPKGQYTYHVELSEWAIFFGRELPAAPEWDGHEPKDVERLLTLPLRDEHGDKWKAKYDKALLEFGRSTAEEPDQYKREAENIMAAYRRDLQQALETIDKLKAGRTVDKKRMEALGEALKSFDKIAATLPGLPLKAKILAELAADAARKAIEGE